MSIKSPHLSVYKRGNVPMNGAAAERNPFSDAASMLLRVLLSGPPRPWRVRDLARAAQTSPALAVLSLRRLEHLGYVSRESAAEARVIDLEGLLRGWAAWYAVKPLEDFRFSFDFAVPTFLRLLARAKDRLPGQWALTSMAGASLVAPFATLKEIHVHLPGAQGHIRSWRNVLGLTPDPLGSLHLIDPYYTDSGLVGKREVRGLPVVSDIQLYLDCFRYPVRGREQAEHILSRLIAPRWRHGR